ncbi:hypothetical protein AAFN85_18915 [Mucilaginibacter sp. CAU 1740]|uniref:hypothetical protein n=1 Tax=Mucilaginibacter sp. CAU 1740 TaxID=3140365 RepID=UPI00325C2C20
MKKIKQVAEIIAFSFSVLLFLPANCFAQTINQITKSLDQYSQATVQEKVFIHTDKSVYMPGEVLWFKAYVVNADDHKPLDLSRVAYVDVLDAKQNAVMQAKIAVTKGLGSGSLYIPVSLTNGNYKLRAYTNWMKNFSADYYFEKNITIVNPLKSPEIPTKAAQPAYDVQFFPEGGNLVAGIASKVAFKVSAENGPVNNFNGAIVNQQNDTVARFKPLKFGIGSFTFTPVAGATYKTIIKVDKGAPVIKSLPDVNSGGYVITLNDNGNQQLEVAVKTKGVDTREVYLFVHTRAAVAIAETASLVDGATRFTIDKAKLGDGVSYITIFNAAKQPVCERLYFKRPKKQLILEATADQPQYSQRKKVNVVVSAKDAAGKPLDANLSMSVYRVDSLQQVDAGDIFSHLWLRSDLRGSIDSASYYVNNTGAEADAALDNLMLSQGWRRFQWNNVLSGKAPAFTFLPERDGHLITGKVTNITTGAPAKDVVAYLSVPGKRVQLYAAESDTAGKITFNTKQLFGPGEIVAQTNTERDSIYRIDIASPFSEQYSAYVEPKFQLVTAMRKAVEEHSLAVQVQNTYTGTKLRNFYEPRVDSSGFYAAPYKTYLLDNYTRFTTMEEVLREYVKEVWVTRTQKRYHIKVLNGNGFLDGDPLVLLDDVPVFNIDKVIAIDPLKVRKLEDVPFRYYWGPSVYEGVLSFTTYKGDLGGVEMDPRAVVLDYEGLQLQREFYSPVYENDMAGKSRLPDFRTTLYWTPNINTGGQQKGQASFYTSDMAGKYIGIVQGITGSGDAGSQYFNFEVR